MKRGEMERRKMKKRARDEEMDVRTLATWVKLALRLSVEIPIFKK